MRRSISHILIASAATLALLTGCSAQPGDSSPVRFQMHWAWSASTAGFALADQDGLLDDVEVIEGRGSGTAVQLVASGQADIGVADAVAIVQQIEQGAPLVVVATMNQVTNIAMQVLDSSGITTVEDLKGKTVAVPQGGAYAFLFPLFLELNGLSEADVTVANVPFESLVASLLEGNVDAIVGGQDTHVALVAQDADFTDFLFADYCVDAVAHSIFTTEDYLERNPEGVREFVANSLQGLGQAYTDPDAAVEAVAALSPGADADGTRVELDFLLPLMCAADASYIGRAEPEHWTRSIDLLERAGLISETLDPDTFVSYDYLPADDELTACD
ncbi:ABC transporter substrate-binding protein [Microbacterium sp. ISL-103]|uniref:ABC transporter substrate-binding protein n=1 Tax=Microbacterium sp. ISL-103 TaxID=2819156 RepID=UPI001BE66A22|nr:ABC transporter substrate-binding protein [Microbacterium sp. ISL-103]MBT2473687.1 ABC transporter substrate-binding protein [Microbacterium sp. ISL-103]